MGKRGREGKGGHEYTQARRQEIRTSRKEGGCRGGRNSRGSTRLTYTLDVASLGVGGIEAALGRDGRRERGRE